METTELKRQIQYEVKEPSDWGIVQTIQEGLNRLGVNVRIKWEELDERHILTISNHSEFDKD